MLSKKNVILLFCLFLTTNELFDAQVSCSASYSNDILDESNDGQENYDFAESFFIRHDYVKAAGYYWRSILFYEELDADYSIQDAFQNFMTCYVNVGRPADGYVFVAEEYLKRGSRMEAKAYAEMALKTDANNMQAKKILKMIEEGGEYDYGNDNYNGNSDDGEYGPNSEEASSWYEKGNEYFANKNMNLAVEAFEKACELSNRSIGSACTNAIYCKTNIASWGNDGEDFAEDMETLKSITALEIMKNRYLDENGNPKWHRFTSVHPHMSLGYPWENGRMKRMVAESYALTDAMYGVAEVTGPTGWQQKLVGFPLDQSAKASKYKYDRDHHGSKIKIGYLCVGVNSKAVMFLAQDVFRFHDKSKFETHILSTGDPDNEAFIQITMRGVDWRKRVQENADYFHDIRHIRKQGPTELAKYISDLGIHVLIDWDGYARQGLRAQGLYYLRPAPVQIMHQEFLGTSGGGFDYIVTDQRVSPIHLEDNYAEKFLYMPHHFFCKGHRMQSEVVPPAIEYKPKQDPYVLGTGSPQENNCGRSGPAPSFVFCNFNKFLKFSPDMFRTWLRILEQVPDSSLCLLAYPMEGVTNLLSFTFDYNSDLIDRVGFLSWENNPFDHQQRNRDYCNVVLDSYPYNGHTTSMDALYAGLPIVTRSDGEDMSSRVVTSANIVLGLTELNAEKGLGEYEQIAVRIGNDKEFYNRMREKVIQAALKDEPKHVFWDMERYTRNFEQGIEIAWETYLNGEQPDHIYVEDDFDDFKGRDEL